MNKRSLILLLSIIHCGNAALCAAAAPPSRTETILFSSTGFTNNSGNEAERNNRAIEAARYLVKRSIEKLFLSSEAPGAPLPQDWMKDIRIINTIRVDNADSSSLHGVRLLGRVTLSLTENTLSNGASTNTELLETSFTSPQNIFYSGEEITFSISGTKDFYGCILDINEKKEAIQLLPNAFRQNNAFAGSRGHIFPDPESGDNFKLEVSPPYGRETIRLVASSYPITTILPITRQEVFAASSRTFQELMLPVYDEITDNLMETGSDRSYQLVQVSTKTLFLKTQERK